MPKIDLGPNSQNASNPDKIVCVHNYQIYELNPQQTAALLGPVGLKPHHTDAKKWVPCDLIVGHSHNTDKSINLYLPRWLAISKGFEYAEEEIHYEATTVIQSRSL